MPEEDIKFIVPEKPFSEIAEEETEEKYLKELSEKKILNRKCNYFCEAITEVAEKNVKIMKKCALCNHPIRIEAERIWDETASAKKVFDFLKSKASEYPELDSFSYKKVENHLYRHYDAVIKEELLKQYSENLRNVINYKINKDRTLEEMIATMQIEMMEIVSDPRMDKMKKIDCLAKINKDIRESIALQAELRGDLSASDITMNKCTEAWRYIITMETDRSMKHKLLETLDLFQQKLDLPDDAKLSAYGDSA